MPTYDPTITLQQLREHWIASALKHFKKKTDAAKALGLNRRTLYRGGRLARAKHEFPGPRGFEAMARAPLTTCDSRGMGGDDV